MLIDCGVGDYSHRANEPCVPAPRSARHTQSYLRYCFLAGGLGRHRVPVIDVGAALPEPPAGVLTKGTEGALVADGAREAVEAAGFAASGTTTGAPGL